MDINQAAERGEMCKYTNCCYYFCCNNGKKGGMPAIRHNGSFLFTILLAIKISDNKNFKESLARMMEEISDHISNGNAHELLSLIHKEQAIQCCVF